MLTAPSRPPPLAPHVSVAYGNPEARSAAEAGSVSVTKGPYVITAHAEEAGPRNPVRLTITGVNLWGAWAIRFVDNLGEGVSGLTASDIRVNDEGTAVTATLSGPASGGRYVVVVVTAAGRSQMSDTGGNTISLNLRNF
jgi:hypothetical protein